MGYIYTKSGKLAKRLYFGAVLLFEGLYYTFKNRVLADGGTFVENELPTISQDASLVLTPNAYKAGKLYSAVPNDGTGDFTVDRNSTATYIGQDGLIKTALANVPRIDWSTGEAVVLVEPQRTNLIPYSEDFSSWNNKGINTILTPYSGYTNIKMSPGGGTYVSNLITLVQGNSYILSIKVRVNIRFSLHIWTSPTSNDAIPPTTVEPNTEWQTIELPFTATQSSVYAAIDNVGNNEASDVDVEYVQLEQGSTATSYIPTNGTTVTRLADDISVPTPAGVTSITETKNGVEQNPITTIPATYSLPVGNINKVTML